MPIDNLSTLARIQRMQHMTLVWMFAKAVSDYNEVLLKHQERCRAIVRQQLMISKLRVLGGVEEVARGCSGVPPLPHTAPTQSSQSFSATRCATPHFADDI